MQLGIITNPAQQSIQPIGGDPAGAPKQAAFVGYSGTAVAPPRQPPRGDSLGAARAILAARRSARPPGGSR